MVSCQMAFVDAVKHKVLITEVAVTAAAEGRTALLGPLYDELCRYLVFSSVRCAFVMVVARRQDWEDLSAKLGEGFVVGDKVGRISADILRRAKSLHDTLLKNRHQSEQSGTSVWLLSCVQVLFHAFVVTGWLEAQGGDAEFRRQ